MKLKVSIVIIVLALLSPTAIAALDMGGEVEIKSSTVVGEQSIGNFLEEKLNLEIFLPETKTTTAKFEIDILTNSQTKSSYHQIKKLYLEKRLENFDLTIGRQPISWMFGSLVNPVDFNLGAETIEQETAVKNVDAVEVYYPLNWGSNISGVLATRDDGKFKYGLRGRATVSGYDLTANFVKEESRLEERIATTIKGDLGAVGAYGSIGYYFEQDSEILLAGMDYSFYHQNVHQIILQGEYIYDKVGMSSYLGGLFTGYSNFLDQKLGPHLIVAMASYGVDDFNTVNLTTLIHPKDSSMLLIPEYETQLIDNLDLNLRCGLLLGSQGEVFGSKKVTTDQDIVDSGDEFMGIIELTVSYPF